jgi:hypothetical protein
VPAEAARLARRPSARDRRFIVVVVVTSAAVAAASAVAVAAERHAGHLENGRCVKTVRASMMGGATFTYCGPAAIRFCTGTAGSSGSTAGACRMFLAARQGH